MTKYEINDSGDSDTFYTETQIKAWLLEHHQVSLSQPLPQVPNATLLTYTVKPVTVVKEAKTHAYQQPTRTDTRTGGYLTITEGWENIPLSEARLKVIRKLDSFWERREVDRKVTLTVGVTDYDFYGYEKFRERIQGIVVNHALNITQPATYAILARSPRTVLNAPVNSTISADILDLWEALQGMMDADNVVYEAHVDAILDETSVADLAAYDVETGWPSL